MRYLLGFLLGLSFSPILFANCTDGISGLNRLRVAERPTFSGKTVVIGFGAVARTVLPVFFELINTPAKNVTIVEMEPMEHKAEPWRKKGVNFRQMKINPANLDATLTGLLRPGDLLLDLAWNIDTATLLEWCHSHGVMYLNTSVEVWDPYDGAANRHPKERTLYHRHLKIRQAMSRQVGKGPSMLVEQGANPGLISSFVKQGLMDIGQSCLQDGKIAGRKVRGVERAMEDANFAALSKTLGVKVIHCSERDTQVSDRPKQVDEFVNTWSVEGFREEGTTVAELGWGTHEKRLPADAVIPGCEPDNQICLARMGINTWVRSWVPHTPITGMVVRHGEAFTLSDFLTVRKNGQSVYRPTVHYAYCPSDAAIASLWELRGRDFQLQSRTRIMTDEITSGHDALGALIMGHPHQSWWTGSILDIEESRRLVPGQNATTVQVAIGIVSAVKWMLENPQEGFFTPERIPHTYILENAKPYLGNFVSTPSNWTPLQGKQDSFQGFRTVDRDPDPWQFCNFLVFD